MSHENSREGLLIRDAQPADLPAADFAGQMRTYSRLSSDLPKFSHMKKIPGLEVRGFFFWDNNLGFQHMISEGRRLLGCFGSSSMTR
jgi:hypothetical protein